eukprot:m.68233 g.68233  ORF g.68233 m.68233 type:complete len:74 (+) comp8499_c2_seq1:908-1129(+)
MFTISTPWLLQCHRIGTKPSRRQGCWMSVLLTRHKNSSQIVCRSSIVQYKLRAARVQRQVPLALLQGLLPYCE